MRYIIVTFVMVFSGALNAEPSSPRPPQKYLLACNANQISVVQSCRARCDESVYECRNRCAGQSCAQQCGPTHNTCQQNCIKGAGC
jgi:hypothetical protein